MLPEDREKLNRVEELKNKLFSKDYEEETERHNSFVLHEKREVPDSWANDEGLSVSNKKSMKTSWFKKFFIFSIAVFVIASLYASYMFFFGGNTVSNDNIDITVLGNTFTDGGEDLPLQIEVVNKNSSALELADLVLEYPKSSSGDPAQDNDHIRNSLGTIPAGGTKSDNVKVVLFGEQGTERTIKISLEYRVAGSNAIFMKEKLYQVSINSAPINLSLEAPDQASPNQEVTFNVKASLNATKAASKILLTADYPPGFQFESAKPAPSFGNNAWSLGDISPGAERDISITGKLVGVFDGEEKTLHIFSGSESDTDKSKIGVVFNSMGHTILIKKPFIDAQLYVNGVYQNEYAINARTAVSGEIRWTNNLDTKINDLVITAVISGNGADRKTIAVEQGYYDSSTNTITWDKNSQNSFAEVNPGDSGSVSFSVSPLSLFSDSAGMISAPSINVDVSISGKQVSDGNAVTALHNSESKVIKIISDVGFAAKALYYSGPFKNSGSIPPQAEKATTYTIVWTLSNTANSVSGAKIVSSLPPWMKFVGTISPATEDISFNPSTKEITWNIGGIPKGTGLTGTSREAAFQVSFLPSASQIGTTPLIINEALLTGHDDFANVDVRVSKSGLSTRLSNDADFPVDGEKVTN